MSNTISTKDLPEKVNIPDDEKWRVEKANILTKLGYCTIDAAETFIMEADSQLSHIGYGLKHKDKYLLSQAKIHANMLKNILQQLASILYDIKENEFALEDSDYIYDLISLTTDRSGSDEEASKKILSMIREMPSKLGLFNSPWRHPDGNL